MIRLFTTLGLAVLLTGCSLGPEYARPELGTPVPEHWARQPELATENALPTSDSGDHWRWWESFKDPYLDASVTAALAHNHDLAAAAARVLEARALHGGTRAAQWPKLEIGGTAARNKTSEAQSFGFSPIYSNSFSASATASYEADLWGRLSSGEQAARATLLASEQNRRAVAQGLIAEVVRTWLQIRELTLQVALTERTVGSYRESLTTVRARYRRGLVSPLDVHLASQNLAAAQTADPVYRRQLAAAHRRLEILTGSYPGGAGTVATEIAMPPNLPAVPAGLPSELLDRRPDLIAAEMNLAASFARVGEAKAALYPRISLTASAGSGSRELSDFLTSGTDFWSLAGNLFMPLLNRGAAKSQVRASEARLEQAAAAYHGAVLQAFAEVENALDQDHHLARQETHLLDSVEHARRSVELAEDRYRRGLESLLVTLDAQRRLFNAESQLLTTQRSRRSARVDLIQALGGPWEDLSESSLLTSAGPNADLNQGAEQ